MAVSPLLWARAVALGCPPSVRTLHNSAALLRAVAPSPPTPPPPPPSGGSLRLPAVIVTSALVGGGGILFMEQYKHAPAFRASFPLVVREALLDVLLVGPDAKLERRAIQRERERAS